MYSFNYAIRSSGQAVKGGNTLLIPGLLIGFANGDPIRLSGTPGWPTQADAGDPFQDSIGRIGFQIREDQQPYNIKQIRTLTDVSDHKVTFDLGPFQAWSSEGVGVSMVTPGTETNQFGYTRPKWAMIPYGSGESFETNYTTDWPWDQQSNGNSDGEDTRPQWLRVIQARYLPGASYPYGAIACPDLGMVLRLEATGIQPPQDPVPGARPWLGWTIDSAGRRNRIRDLTPAEAQKIGHDNGFVPPDKDLVTRSGQSYQWQHMRVLSPFGRSAVAASGVLLYQEDYERYPEEGERPYYTSGYPGFNSSRQSVPFAEPVNWIWGDIVPLSITESRNTFLFCEMVIGASSITSLIATGRSTSGAARVQIGYQGVDPLNYYAFKRYDGVVDVIFRGSAYDNYIYTNTVTPVLSYDPTRPLESAIRSPNGWDTAVYWPALQAPNGSLTALPGYMPVAAFPDRADMGSRPPVKPSDWDDETQGPWVEPPFDVNVDAIWRGHRYWDPDERRFAYSQRPNDTFSSNAISGFVTNSNTFANQNGQGGNYTRTGARQRVGVGTWTLFRHFRPGGPFTAGRAAGLIVPAVQGNGFDLQQSAVDDGGDAVARFFPWAKKRVTFAKSQFGTWKMARGSSAYVNAPFDLGSAMGEVWITADLSPGDVDE